MKSFVDGEIILVHSDVLPISKKEKEKEVGEDEGEGEEEVGESGGGEKKLEQ